MARVFLRVDGEVLINTEAVTPDPQPPVLPPSKPPEVPPVASGKPLPIGQMFGPALEGKGNPQITNNIPANCIVSYHYRLRPQDTFLEFRAAGQSTNGTPNQTWAWLSVTPGGNPIGLYENVSGSNVAVVPLDAMQIRMLMDWGVAALWFNEQPSDPCNRYAQVN